MSLRDRVASANGLDAPRVRAPEKSQMRTRAVMPAWRAACPILVEAPDVNGNRQRKMSPNISAQGFVDGVLGRIVSQELLVGAGAPLGLTGVLASVGISVLPS